MPQSLSLVSIVVRDYDQAIQFYCDRLGFALVEDTPLDAQKRWVVVRPRGPGTAGLLLAKASNSGQEAVVGGQIGSRKPCHTARLLFSRISMETCGI